MPLMWMEQLALFAPYSPVLCCVPNPLSTLFGIHRCKRTQTFHGYLQLQA